MNSRPVSIATCSVNQWALDWEGNTARILDSIKRSKAAGARLRVGPELEITGSDCLDAFFEDDLYLHAWEMLGRILVDKDCHDILTCIGMPIKHGNFRYNCSVFILDGKILLIQPQKTRRNEQNYRDARYFDLWKQDNHVEGHQIPRFLQQLQGSKTVPFGDCLISTAETSIGTMPLAGAEILVDNTRYHHQLGRLDEHVSSMCQTTKDNGGVSIYSNLKGGAGERVYYEGSSKIIVNGAIISEGPRFSLDDVEVTVAMVDLEQVTTYRGPASVTAASPPRLTTPFSLAPKSHVTPSPRYDPKQTNEPELAEEIALGPACWLWDYLRRSNMAGFIVPLSGGIDSCCSAMMVFMMCRHVMNGVTDGNIQVTKDVRRIAGAYHRQDYWVPSSPQELCNHLLHTAYMGMPQQSSSESRRRAQELHEAIGSYHFNLSIGDVYEAQKDLFTKMTGFDPKFKVFGGSKAEDLALQNIQARLRMVTAYQFGQLLPTSRQRWGGGCLLVMASTNSDEALRGNYTRYDCSSGDLNAIGSISKNDLRKFITWALHHLNFPILQDFLDATPSAELEPITEDYCQTDDQDLGLSYDELETFAICRKVLRLGPVGTYQKLAQDWSGKYSSREIATKVKHFYQYLAQNRHKTNTLTPAYHSTSYSPHNNWCDFRQILNPPQCEGHAFKRIDLLVLEQEELNKVMT